MTLLSYTDKIIISHNIAIVGLPKQINETGFFSNRIISIGTSFALPFAKILVFNEEI